MLTHEYEFAPGDVAYAVIGGDCVKEVTVLQYSFETYITDGPPATVMAYTVQYTKEAETAYVMPENLFETASEALAQVDLNLMGDLSSV